MPFTLAGSVAEELRAIAADFNGHGEVGLSEGRKAFLAKGGEEARVLCAKQLTELTSVIPITGVTEILPGVYAFIW